MSSDDLAIALERLAQAIQSNPSSVIGQKITAVAGPGSTGPVVGMTVTATAGPSSRGTVIGNQVNVSSAQGRAADAKLVKELMDAVAAVRKGEARKSWVEGLIDRVKALGNAALTAALTTATSALVASGLK